MIFETCCKLISKFLQYSHHNEAQSLKKRLFFKIFHKEFLLHECNIYRVVKYKIKWILCNRQRELILENMKRKLSLMITLLESLKKLTGEKFIGFK